MHYASMEASKCFTNKCNVPRARAEGQQTRSAPPLLQDVTNASLCARMGLPNVPHRHLIANVADSSGSHTHGDYGDIGT